MYRRYRSDEEPAAKRDVPAPEPAPDAMKPVVRRARRRTAADRPCNTGARHLTDAQLRTLLHDLRAHAAARTDASALEPAIASLECEAAARGLVLTSDVSEPTPPQLAFDLFLRSLPTRDRELAGRALDAIEAAALFLACRRIREVTDRDFRLHCLRRVLHRMDAILLGPVVAAERYERQSHSVMNAADLEAYVELCIASMYAVALSQPYDGGGR